jgi:hypothetical protein
MAHRRTEDALLDSGTTFTYVTHDMFAAMRQKLTEACSSSASYDCGALSNEDPSSLACFNIGIKPPTGPWPVGTAPMTVDIRNKLRRFPSMTVILSGGAAVLQVPAIQYLTPQGSSYCVGVYSDSSVTLGMNFLMNNNIYFDRENKRIGVVRSCCSGDQSQCELHDACFLCAGGSCGVSTW